MKAEKCYFYSEYHDMGASIPCCSLHDGLGVCPCEDCDKFLSRADAFDIVLKHIKGDDRPTGHWIYEHRQMASVPTDDNVTCNSCGVKRARMHGDILKYCPNCGAKMESEE